MSGQYKDIIVGGGHNGLVCAAYLARAGRAVLFLEAADDVGGAARTRSLGEKARVSAAAHLLYGMPADLLRELQLESHGLVYAKRSLPTISLHEQGSVIQIDGDSVTGEGVSAADKAAYVRFSSDMRRFARALKPAFNDLPPELSIETWNQRLTLLKLGLKIRGLGRYHMRELLRIIAMNLYDLLDEYFESPQLKAAIAMDAVLGGEWGPRSMGTVMTYLYRVSGYERSGGAGIALPKGGMGTVTAAIANAARAAGVEIRTGARVARIVVEDDRACGVELESGEVVRADNVISNADPKRTFLELLGTEHLDTGFVRQVRNLRSKGRAAKLHLLLNGTPQFKGVSEERLGSRFLIAPSADDIELAFNPCKYGEYPHEPVWEISVPSALDRTLCSDGQHVVSAILQFLPFDDSDDAEANRAAFTERALKQLEAYAPGIGQQVVVAELLTPADIEREFGMSGGHWHHVELALENFLFNRPTPLLSRHTAPISGLYLCGAGCHPGGNVMGIAGRNAAGQVIRGGR
jgi:phytoene dehydrogenase-like protein